MQYVGSVMRASIKAHVKPGDGVFVTSCVQHEMAWTSADSAHGPFGPMIGGCTHAEAVAAWVSKQLGEEESGGSRKVSDPHLILTQSSPHPHLTSSCHR